MQRDMIEGLDISNQSCEYCLNMIFRNSQFSQKFKGYSNIINAQNFKIGPTKLLTAIGGTEGSIIDTFGTGAELLRDNENIHILNKRGNDNGVIIEYAENLTGLDITEDEDGLITRIRAKAKYTPEGGEETEIFTYVDSSHIFEYETPFIGEIDFSDKFEDGEIPTVEKLTKLGEAYFRDNKCDVFEGNYKIQFIPLSKCAGYEDIEDKISLCDTVTIKDYRYNLDTKAKVIKATYDFLRERYESMEVGQPRTTLGDVVGGSDSNKGEQGPPGPQGPPGKDGNIGDFPDSLPSKPVLSAKLYGFNTIELSWTYENKVYYNYELYASKTKDFTPNVFDIIHAGQTSSFLFQAKPNETWYFRICAVNSHGNRTEFSSQIAVTTKKIDDLSNYFEDAAIGRAVVGSLTADYMEAGIIKGNWVDAKNLSVTDGNGKRTLDIDSFGNVNLDVNQLNIRSKELSIGGDNLLRRTDFDDVVKHDNGSITEWNVWEDTFRPYNNARDNNSTATLKMYFNNEGVPGGMYQDIPSRQIPKGTTLVISYELSIQKNINNTYISVEYTDSNHNVISRDKIINFLNEDGTPAYGYQYHVFTTPTDIDYGYVRICLNSAGNKSGAGGSYIVITLKNLMLEKGTYPSSWKKGTSDYSTKSELQVTKDNILSTVSKTYATQSAVSEVKQTAESVTYKFSNSSQTNLLPHSGVSSKNTTGWIISGDGSWHQGHNRYLGIRNNTGTEMYGCSPTFSVGASGWYSLHGWINAESNTKGADVFIIGSRSDDRWSYDWTHHCCNVGSNSGWHHFYSTFEVPSDIKTLWVRVDNNGIKDTSSVNYVVVFFGEFMLVRGKENYPLYTDSVEGLYTGVTSIDKNGVHVTHNDGSSTNLNAKALNFYDTSNTLYAQVNGGLYKFWYGSNYIGYLGHAKWSGTENRVVGMNSEYGQMSTLASKKASSDNFFQVYLIANGCDQTINGVRYRQGATLITPHIGTRLYLYTNGYYTDTYPSFIVNNNEGHIIVAGDNGVNLGTLVGNNYYDAIRITEIGSSPYVKIDMWGNVDMHNWNLVNANISKSVSATSTQTYALRTLSNEESYSDPTSSTITDTYGVQSLTNGDVRWSDKQTYFTSEVEEGIYEAYVEIPWWLAQNIELNYHVNITPVNGFYQYYLSERDPYYFIVRSDKDSMGFTFEIVATLLEQNTLNNNASIAGAQYLTSEVNDGEQPDINVPDINVPDSSYK